MVGTDGFALVTGARCVGGAFEGARFARFADGFLTSGASPRWAGGFQSGVAVIVTSPTFATTCGPSSFTMAIASARAACFRHLREEIGSSPRLTGGAEGATTGVGGFSSVGGEGFSMVAGLEGGLARDLGAGRFSFGMISRTALMPDLNVCVTFLSAGFGSRCRK